MLPRGLLIKLISATTILVTNSVWNNASIANGSMCQGTDHGGARPEATSRSYYSSPPQVPPYGS